MADAPVTRPYVQRTAWAMSDASAEFTRPTGAWVAACRKEFRDALAAFSPARPILILGHHDADGLSSTAILSHALERSGRHTKVRLLGRGENVWSPEMAAELRAPSMGHDSRRSQVPVTKGILGEPRYHRSGCVSGRCGRVKNDMSWSAGRPTRRSFRRPARPAAWAQRASGHIEPCWSDEGMSRG